MTTYKEVAEKHSRHLNPQFIKLLGVLGYGRLFQKADGCHVSDSEGRRYVDFVAAYGAINLGHNHPRIAREIERVLREEKPYQFLHFAPNEAAADLAEALARRLGGDLSVSLFSSSGSEAVEAAMKLAIAATGRTRFIYCRDGYHGTGLGSLSIMGQDKPREPFEDVLALNEKVPFGDLGALEAALRGRDVAAFIVEPILGEGGVIFPPNGYLAEARALCRKHKALFVLDEVQTGFGRVGQWFSCSSWRPEDAPDAVVLAKGLSGGVMPIGATVTTPEIHRRAYGTRARFDLHGSTYGGNALSCRVALETMRVLEDEKLVERSRETGAWLLERLRAALAGHPMVADVRGQGLLIAIEVGPTEQGMLNRVAPGVVEAVSELAFGQWISYCLLERGFLVQPATHKWNVLKIVPPLSVERADCERLVEAFREIFGQYRSISSFTRDITSRISSRFFTGGR